MTNECNSPHVRALPPPKKKTQARPNCNTASAARCLAPASPSADAWNNDVPEPVQCYAARALLYTPAAMSLDRRTQWTPPTSPQRGQKPTDQVFTAHCIMRSLIPRGAGRWQALIELRPFLVFESIATRQVCLGQGVARMHGEQQACSLGTAQRRPQFITRVFFFGHQQSQAR